jgi:hypothetical protein
MDSVVRCLECPVPEPVHQIEGLSLANSGALPARN